jgi:hypothetical protein
VYAYYGETLEGAVSARTPGIRVRAPRVRRSVSVQTELYAHTSALVFASATYTHKHIYTHTYTHPPTHTHTYIYNRIYSRTNIRAVRAPSLPPPSIGHRSSQLPEVRKLPRRAPISTKK